VRLASMERLDPERGIWIPMEQMMTPRSNLGVAIVGDDILAIGGYNGRSVDASVEVYNVFEDKWLDIFFKPFFIIGVEKNVNFLL
jgi:influenza virus NS1A-binding protein